MIPGPFVKIELIKTTNPDWPFGTRATFESGKTGNGSKLFKNEEDCKKFLRIQATELGFKALSGSNEETFA